MGEDSISNDCRMVPEIASLVLRAEAGDEAVKSLIKDNALDYLAELINCIDTYDKHIEYQESINNSLQRIADSSGRRADIYESAFKESGAFTKQLVEAIHDLVNASAYRVVADVINALNTSGILKEGFVLEQPAPFEIMPPIKVDMDNMTISGGLDTENRPTLTINATRSVDASLPGDVLLSQTEMTTIDFKREFHPEPLSKEATGAWCELVKDIVAMANTDGGYILIGLCDDGTPSGIDVSAFASTDPAIIGDKIYSYTGMHFNGFRIHTAYKSGKQIAVLKIDSAWPPLVFIKTGNYADSKGKQKSAFNPGLYVRHNAKSEPFAPSDLAKIIEKAASKGEERIERAISNLFSNMSDVVDRMKSALSEVKAAPSTDDANTTGEPLDE